MASIIWDSQGVIMIYYLEHDRTINGAYYAGELRRLHQEMARERRRKLTCGVLLLQDHAPAHTSQAMTAATECGFEIPPHPPYSPDMAPSDFYLYPKLKSHLHGTQYGSNACNIEAVKEYLGDQEKAYFEGIRKLEQKRAKCIALKGDYIEKLWSNFHSLVARSTRGQVQLFDHPS